VTAATPDRFAAIPPANPLPQGERECCSHAHIYPPSPCGRGSGGGVWRTLIVAALVVCAMALQAIADENGLWRIVSEQCVPDQKLNHMPNPCVAVDLAGGYALLKTARISGIESPAVLAPNAPNYWADAWRARHYVEERALHHLPRDALGLAINSINGRSQNQLHIHIDCMRVDVTAALREHAAAVGPGWAKFPVPLVGHDYMAMRIDRPELGAANPFVLLADGVAGARGDMGHYTLVVVGSSAQGKDGFIVLAGHATPAVGNWGEGEQLQDHDCAAATAASR
jgi:CDP-diacylglycerol pyrophosphatase